MTATDAPLLHGHKHAENVALLLCVRLLSVANHRHAIAKTPAQRRDAWRVAERASQHAWRSGVGPDFEAVRTAWAGHEYGAPVDMTIGHVIAGWQRVSALPDDEPLDNSAETR